MSRFTTKRRNDGDKTGLKQDKYRNSEFEYEGWRDQAPSSGVMRKTANTLSGPYEENRGRRNASERLNDRDNNPFENGRLYNWNHRQGWDRHFDASYDKEGNRPHGGALRDHDGSHFGKGPKGYKRADDSIREDVCEMLTLSPDIDASDIEVEVKDGCVYLNGRVDSRGSKRKAELAIENISGVFDVQNQLSWREENKTAPRSQPNENVSESRH